MPHYKYLIIGGGMTAAAAMIGIRSLDPNGAIGLIGAETDAPYNRPPLSKGLWKGKPLEKIWRKIPPDNTTLHLGRRARDLDAAGRRVADDQGGEYTYERLLLATGGTPRHLPFGKDSIVYYRTLSDYRRLRELADTHQRFAVIGGGFIGSEIAAALAMNGKAVTLVFPGEGIGARQFPGDLAEFLNGYYRDHGVEVLAGEEVDGLERHGGEMTLHTKGGRRVVADAMVAGIGIEPNVEIARDAGLAVDDGIAVDASLRTSHPDIYAAGDVASFYNPDLDKRLRVEHEDHANTMGKMAGRAMAGEKIDYRHLPSFYSDLFDLGYEAVGELDPRLDVVADWQERHRKGVIYYLGHGRVRGVLLWNVWSQVDSARELIAQPGPFRAEDLKGRITG